MQKKLTILITKTTCKRDTKSLLTKANKIYQRNAAATKTEMANPSFGSLQDKMEKGFFLSACNRLFFPAIHDNVTVVQ